MLDKEHKVNIKARIDRHSRWLKENITLKNKVFNIFKKNNIVYKTTMVFLLLSVPVYPMFAWVIHNNNELEFYRWYIDEDSILWSYYEEKVEVISDDMMESTDEFLADNWILNEDRNYEWTNEIRKYKIKSWDSMSLIASKFKVSMETIYVFNELAKNYIPRPWKELLIPATSWIPYKVKKWDTLLAIASKYKIDTDDIEEFNNLDNSNLKIWNEIFLPWAKKIIPPKPEYIKPAYIKPTKTYTKKTNYVWNQYSSSKWVYKLKWRKPFSWAWWNCTYYVASYKNVNWRWNANRWMANAAAKWHKVIYWRTASPMLWSIVVLEWRGYNLRYGHVAIVMEVKDWYMIVSDMNYRRLNEVTYRKVSLNSKNITWYIYVN